MNRGNAIYKYKLINLKESSSKYGNCEVCHKWADSVYSQTEYKKYKFGYYETNTLFGHKDCLLKNRKKEDK